MDSATVDLVLTGLAAAGAGASAGLQDATKSAVTDAYQALVGQLKAIWPRQRRSHDGSPTTQDIDAEDLINRYRGDPAQWDSTIREILRSIEDPDPAVAKLAAHLCSLTNGEGVGDNTVFANNIGVQDARMAYKPQQSNYFGPTVPQVPTDGSEDQ